MQPSNKVDYQNVIGREDLTREIWQDVLLLCVLILFIRNILLDFLGEHWLIGSVLEGFNYIVGTAIAALIIIVVVPKRMKYNLSLISNAI